jgi:hypothetical protein
MVDASQMNEMRRPPEAGLPRIHYSVFARRLTLPQTLQWAFLSGWDWIPCLLLRQALTLSLAYNH